MHVSDAPIWITGPEAKTMKTTSRNTMKLKTLLLAACLAAALPAAVRAQNAAVDKDAMAFLSATYLECGTYYYAIAMCTVDERDKYNEMARTLFERSVDIDGIVESREEYI